MLEIDLEDATYRWISFPTLDQDADAQLKAAFFLQTIERLIASRRNLATRDAADILLPDFDAFLGWIVNASPDQIETHMRTPAFGRAVMTMILRSPTSSKTPDDTLIGTLRSLSAMRAPTAEERADRRITLDGIPVGLWPLVGNRQAIEVTGPVSGDVVLTHEDGRAVLSGPEATLGLVRIVPRRLLLNGDVERLDADQFPELGHNRHPSEHISTLDDVALDRMLKDALQAIAEIWPAGIAQVKSHFSGVLPMHMDVENWNSASTNELPYVLQLTFREAGWPLLLAESLIHETSHVKLDMALWVNNIVEDDGRRDFSHPWRPDPRPISGVLYGAHAFLAVVGFYARAQERFPDDERVQKEWDLRRKEVRQALDTLSECTAFTSVGTRVYGCLEDAYAAVA